MADSSTSSSPSLSASTPPSSVPSPEIQSLSLSESTPRVVSEEDRKQAAELKAQANKAFVGELLTCFRRDLDSLGILWLIDT